MKSESGDEMRLDDGKLRFDLIPEPAMQELAKLYTKGAEKYSPWGWAKGMAYSRVIGAMFRHIYKYIAGETYDEETGCHHMIAVGWGAFAIVCYDKWGFAVEHNDMSINQEEK